MMFRIVWNNTWKIILVFNFLKGPNDILKFFVQLVVCFVLGSYCFLITVLNPFLMLVLST